MFNKRQNRTNNNYKKNKKGLLKFEGLSKRKNGLFRLGKRRKLGGRSRGRLRRRYVRGLGRRRKGIGGMRSLRNFLKNSNKGNLYISNY